MSSNRPTRLFLGGFSLPSLSSSSSVRRCFYSLFHRVYAQLIESVVVEYRQWARGGWNVGEDFDVDIPSSGKIRLVGCAVGFGWRRPSTQCAKEKKKKGKKSNRFSYFYLFTLKRFILFYFFCLPSSQFSFLPAERFAFFFIIILLFYFFKRNRIWMSLHRDGSACAFRSLSYPKRIRILLQRLCRKLFRKKKGGGRRK